MVAHSSLTLEHGFANALRTRLDPPNACAALQPRPSPGHGQPGSAQTPRNTHFHTFRSQEDFGTIIRTSALLEESGFYWGPLAVNVAHEKLKGQPVGTFLLRDSRQKNCFFAVSVKTATGPTSIRVVFHAGRFGFHGGNETFDCLFKLLEYYAGPPRKMLGRPLLKRPLRPLQELCRKSILSAVGRDNLSGLPLNPVLKDYLQTFPFTF